MKHGHIVGLLILIAALLYKILRTLEKQPQNAPDGKPSEYIRQQDAQFEERMYRRAEENRNAIAESKASNRLAR